MTLTILIYFTIFLLIYFAADALHDVWVKKESDLRLQAKRAKNNGDAELSKKLLKEASKVSGKWHALDAAIKGFAIANLSYWIVGWDWWLLILAFDAAAIRWIWFDLSWNKFRGVEWNHLGTVAKTDKFFSSFLFQFAFKLFFLLVAVIITVHKLQLG